MDRFRSKACLPAKSRSTSRTTAGLSLRGFSTTRIEYNGPVPNRRIELTAGQSVSGVKIYVGFWNRRHSGTSQVRRVERCRLKPSFTLSVNRQGGPSQFGGTGGFARTIPHQRHLAWHLRGRPASDLAGLDATPARVSAPCSDRPSPSSMAPDTEVLFNVNLSGKDVP